MVDDTVLTAKAAALAGFADTGPGRLNCAQAVVRFAAILLGAGEDSVVLARYMGGGMTGMGEVCGALSGAALSVGLRDQLRGLSWADRSSPAAEKLQQLFRRFEAEFGATACRELVGYRTDSIQAYERFKAEGKYQSCQAYVSWTCDQLPDILEATNDCPSRGDQQPGGRG
jgi:C_GCAxxG_C_C family probable redox protein